MPTYQVEVNKEAGYIRILRRAWPTTPAKEMLYWDHGEWEEDPEGVYAIANAIALSALPDAMDAKMREMGKLK